MLSLADHQWSLSMTEHANLPWMPAEAEALVEVCASIVSIVHGIELGQQYLVLPHRLAVKRAIA